ncbi:hypothetical protein OG453_12025 [Streptomyces sp. NBC_01381]|uniref:hypothetical protein n=1 Tax=Streptomyces sp. NBC_01381 TaxID=2903845 RepID=UPI0022513449|nr:hypothetical protein [Streptomyces sp. NBC_01381]MCX4667382.1 hypothetical protein [Streptomyces sp. NBC_01381]
MSGMPAKAPLKNVPGLTTFTVNDLARWRAEGAERCVEQIAKAPNNPVNALIRRPARP